MEKFEPPKNPYPFLSHYTYEYARNEAFQRGVGDTIKAIEKYIGCTIEETYVRLHPPRKKAEFSPALPLDVMVEM